MTTCESTFEHQDFYEYHGSTIIERTRQQGGETILRDWLLFDTVEEAREYFDDRC